MRVLLFNLLLLTFLTSFNIQAQKKQIYLKSFEVDKNSNIIFNLDNTTVGIEESTDGKIHFDFSMEFENYSKNEIKNIVDSVKIKVGGFEKNITLEASGITKSNSHFSVNTKEALVLDSDFFKSKKKEKKVLYKSKNSLIEEINTHNKSSLENLLKMLKTKDEKGVKKKLSGISIQVMKSDFSIKIPPHVKLVINSKDSQITFLDDFTNELSLVLRNGYLRAQTLANNHNNLKISDASLKVEKISGGIYYLNNISIGKIGSLNSVKITSEFSKIEIGEINQGIVINDFNSEFWFYNFSRGFKRFDLFSEYSKVHIFKPLNNYSFKAFGNNTVIHDGGTVINMQPTKNGEKYNMFTRKSAGSKEFSGHINFDMIHGMIYSYRNKTKS